MAIKGLTHQKPQFPEVGQLRKGAKKPERGIGKDLTYFRFTSEIPEVMTAFESAYDGEPRMINVFLPFRYTDENWEAWQEEYRAGGLVHRCDGETMVLWQKPDGGYSTDPKPCTGKCKPTGRLKVIVPELRRLAYVTVLTTSNHDIRNLDAQIRALETLRGDLTGIPLQLRRRPHKISTPSGTDGKRARREMWLLSIEAAPKWVDLQLAAQEAAAIPHPVSIPATATPDNGNDVVVNGATGEILEEDLAWDGQVFDAGEDDTPNLSDAAAEDLYGPADNPEAVGEKPPEQTVPLPDFLTVQIPQGAHLHAGQTIFWLLKNDPDYLGTVASGAKDMEIRRSAEAAIEWAKEVQPTLM